MSYHLMQLHAPLLRQTIVAAGVCLFASQGLAQRADTPFVGLAGYWSGGGSITLANGASERIRCKATYAVHSSGRAMNQSLRCASDSYKLEITSNILYDGGAVSGSWSEATRNVSGNISGRASSAEIQARVAGGAFTASLDVRTRGSSQSVTIRPQGGTNVTGVSITLRKG
ncbi:hypothetical protein [Methylocapsa aurea]|uniref:hypothetical protein n=1 Tax=Methylocapsa aurea TaxID=663610 RepID=UPI001FD9B7C9|nr:hypothetical protein [Methylocapsa aurea]